MAPICRSRKPASTRAASARSMKAKPSRSRAGRVSPPAPRKRPTQPKLSRCQTPRSRRSFPGAFLLAWLLVEPALEHAHVADVGAEHDVEGVARDRYEADHAVDGDIAEHPRRNVPGRPERARLPHDPERNRRRDDVADHGDQADQPVDAVADIRAGQDEGDIKQFREGFEPRQPLLARQIAEWIGGGMAKIEPQALELRAQARIGYFAPLLVDDRPAPGRARPGRRPGARTRRRVDIFV